MCSLSTYHLIQTDCYNSVFDTFCSLNYIFNSDLLLLGDFNIPDYNSNISNFQNFLELQQFNSINNVNNRLLDLVLANKECEVERAVDILLDEDTHHPSIVILYNIRTKQKNNKIIIKPTNYYNFKKANFPLLYQNLFEIDWSFLSNINEVELATQQFYDKLDTVFSECVPKSIPPSHTYPPWFNGELIKNIKRKHKLWRKYKNNNNINILNEYKELRRSTKTEDKDYIGSTLITWRKI